eukprot:3521103-Pyramimonas_sp.AAC.1
MVGRPRGGGILRARSFRDAAAASRRVDQRRPRRWRSALHAASDPESVHVERSGILETGDRSETKAAVGTTRACRMLLRSLREQ